MCGLNLVVLHTQQWISIYTMSKFSHTHTYFARSHLLHYYVDDIQQVFASWCKGILIYNIHGKIEHQFTGNYISMNIHKIIGIYISIKTTSMLILYVIANFQFIDKDIGWDLRVFETICIFTRSHVWCNKILINHRIEYFAHLHAKVTQKSFDVKSICKIYYIEDVIYIQQRGVVAKTLIKICWRQKFCYLATTLSSI